jgi:hypothetical protein
MGQNQTDFVPRDDYINLGNYIVDESIPEGDDSDDDPSWWDEESCLVAIDLGYDEGGSGDRLLVSVQIGVTGNARKLKKMWKERLPPRLPYFHSKDFGNRAGGVFTKADLGMAARKRLLSDLTSIIHRHLIAAVTASISIGEYDSLTTQDFRSRVGTAYAFAVNACLLCAYALVVEKNLKPEFNVLIENGHRNSNQVAQILDRLQKIPAEIQANSGEDVIPDLRLLSVGWGGKGDHPILQAADMMAYSEWQGIRESGDPRMWHAIKRAAPPSQYSIYRIDCNAELIREFVSNGTKAFIRKQRKKVRANGKQQRVSEIQQSDGHNPEGRSKDREAADGRGHAAESGSA